MKRWLAALAALALLCPGRAQAHLGSPDVFFDGLAGPYPISVTIRVPGVVPGRAQIIVRVRTDDPATVAIAPIAAKTDVANTPPPEPAQAVSGETNLFNGELWLMTRGAYGIDVRIHGGAGEGAVQIPVNSVATHLLPLPSYLGKLLAVLALILVGGGVAIVAAAAGESVLAPGQIIDRRHQRRYVIAGSVTAAVFLAMLVGGRAWWNGDEAKFRTRLRDGGWPDLSASVRIKDAQRILTVRLDDPEMSASELAPALDHGKMMHLYLARLPNHAEFAHLHPVRSGDPRTFDVVLPALPEGDYEVLCDVTLAKSGISSTATNVVHLPPIPAGAAGVQTGKADPDDSWALGSTVAASAAPGRDTICRLPDGTQIIWKAHPSGRVQQDAGLRFEVRDETGQPVVLEAYMGMLCHAAVLRSDGRVFSHLHPSGNYSMAAQYYFDAKLGKQGADALRKHDRGLDPVCGRDSGGASPLLTLPYEFPSPGNYRLWVQFKTGGTVHTAIFDTSVSDATPASL